MNFITLVGRIIKRCSSMACTVHAEPGFLTSVVQVWVLSATQNAWRPGVQTAALETILYLLAPILVDIQNHPERHAQLVEASGGSLGDFAALVAHLISHMANDDMKKSIHFMKTALGTIFVTIYATQTLHSQFPRLLLEQGIVRTLVTTLRHLHSRSPHGDQALPAGFDTALAYMIYIIQALDAGLFQVLAYFLENPRVVGVEKLRDFFVKTLGCSLAFRSLLIPLRSSLASVHINVAPDSPNWDTWSFFLAATDELMPLVQTHDSRDRVSMRACDNVECVRVSRKTDFKSCSGCESVHYCSRNCQRSDWKRGHSKHCAAIRIHSIKDPETVSHRDLSFFPTMVEDMHTTTPASILLAKLVVMHRKLNTEHFTTFQYINGEFKVQTEPATRNEPGFKFGRDFFGPIWDDQLSRVAASGGRMLLHVFVANEGPGKCVGRILPLRMRNGALRAGLEVLSREVPPGMERPRDFKRHPGFVLRVEALARLTCRQGEFH
ncbi:hypothetical protein FB45DRAFT_867824 [Roridomyces roridus]|uniref:MYND-type domain-containing protein n=1 Tax=Roridomyces roridus TaxID=1738132 RepID=A0AAD7FN07_9AGAR|nr:hypothetical protein FB45DRAFT_867824 [Roridomyces roridus]